jgi:arsenite methyltransferase
MTKTHRDEVREAVRKHYARAATEAARGAFDAARRIETDAARGGTGCGCGESAAQVAFGAVLYREQVGTSAPEAAAIEASLGCGVPTAVADLHEGEIVLDLGAGAGADVLISARRVGPTGTAIGLDMTDEMLRLARRNAREAGIKNAEFRKGTIEQIPLPDSSVDVIISNCVINLSADKLAVFREAARVLRSGGRFAVTDVVADEDMPETTSCDITKWTGCIDGALTRVEFARGLRAAGFAAVEIRETHRVHEHAGSAIIRARLP